jgi:hypothetical protein
MIVEIDNANLMRITTGHVSGILAPLCKLLRFSNLPQECCCGKLQRQMMQDATLDKRISIQLGSIGSRISS